MNCILKRKDRIEMSKKWLKCAGIRAVKTAAQTAVAMLPVAAAINQVDWKMVIGTAALAFVASMLTSLAGIPEVDNEEAEE